MQFGNVLVKKSQEQWPRSVCVWAPCLLVLSPCVAAVSPEPSLRSSLCTIDPFGRRPPVIKMCISQWRALKCPLIPLAVGESTAPSLGGDGLIFPPQASYGAGCAAAGFPHEPVPGWQTFSVTGTAPCAVPATGHPGGAWGQ